MDEITITIFPKEFLFFPMGIIDSIFGSKENSAANQTKLPYNLNTLDGRDRLMIQFLKIKKIKSLNELQEEQFLRIFGEEKSHVIDNYLSGIGGTEDKCVAMVIISDKLKRKHGDLEEVHCMDNELIALHYKDHHIITIGDHSGDLDLTLIKYGYRGTGPDCFHAFLNENGFKISKDDIANITPQTVLKKGEIISNNSKESKIDDEDPQELHYCAKRLHNSGRYDEAIKYYDKLLIIEPYNAKIWYLRGEAFRIHGRYSDAISSYKHSLVIKPDCSEAWYELAESYRYSQQKEEALAAYTEGLKYPPKYHEGNMWEQRGRFLLEMNRYEEAITSFDEAIKRPHHTGDLEKYRGYALMQINRYDEAIVSFDEAIKSHRNDGWCWKQRGIACAKAGRYSQALESFKIALETYPDDAEIWLAKGNSLCKNRQYEEAIDSYNRAIKIKPQCLEALNRRGKTFEKVGRNYDAIMSYDKVLEIDPNNVQTLCDRGLLLYKIECYDEAEKIFDQSSKIDPDYTKEVRSRLELQETLRRKW